MQVLVELRTERGHHHHGDRRLGTTINPYLFFWQASEEVEDMRLNAKTRPFNEQPRKTLNFQSLAKRFHQCVVFAG